MVHIPTRGDVPVRLGPGAQQLPGYGAHIISRSPYTDPMQFELEREKVLGAAWLLVCRSAQVADSGDWFSFDTHGETVVVTCQPDGNLSAFHNVCQHRGVAIVGPSQGCGARRFTCPYHGWVYDTTGKLVGVPRARRLRPRAPCRTFARPRLQLASGEVGCGSTSLDPIVHQL